MKRMYNLFLVVVYCFAINFLLFLSYTVIWGMIPLLAFIILIDWFIGKFI